MAINIPLALLFAFAVLYLRGKSANLLSIGAVDFGIIVDSSVIMVENIYRASQLRRARRSAAAGPDRASRERSRAQPVLLDAHHGLCPVAAVHDAGPRRQLFGPMAETYAFALGGALLLAVTLSPVLCLILFAQCQARPGQLLGAHAQESAPSGSSNCACVIAPLFLGAGWRPWSWPRCAALPFLGREFMPELEEGHLWIRGDFSGQHFAG